jgi:transposase
MRTLKLHFPEQALPTLDTFLKQTKEARLFRRAQAVREVVQGHRLQTVSASLHFTYAALRKGGHRFASQGVQGLADRPRPGRPPKVTCELAYHLDRLVDQDPLQHGSSHSQWSCQELATVFARQTGVQLSRESVRDVLKKKTSVTAGPRAGSLPTPLSWRGLHSNSRPSSTEPTGVRSFCSMKMKPSSGGLPCPGRAGGAKPNALACPPGH